MRNFPSRPPRYRRADSIRRRRRTVAAAAALICVGGGLLASLDDAAVRELGRILAASPVALFMCDGNWAWMRRSQSAWLNQRITRGDRAMGTWTKIDKAGAAYLLLNTVFWWTPLLLLGNGLEVFVIGAALGLVRDAVLLLAWLGHRHYKIVRLQRSLT